MATPLVSILIPAYRGRWLDVAIASALAQTVTDTEIVISDDSAGDQVAGIAGKWKDPRVRYLRNPHRGLIGTNRDNLIQNARGRYLKFLFDDDVLLPGSVELLLSMLERTRAKLAFHSRHWIDDDGRVFNSPRYTEQAGAIELTHADFFLGEVAKCRNSIGEPSNILMDAGALRSIAFPYTVQERRMGFLSDVALYTNFMDRDLGMVGTGQIASAFRMHGTQTSGQGFAGYSAGLFEWEFLRRWAGDRNYLSVEAFDAGHPQQMALYAQHLPRYPELSAFVNINGRRKGGRFLSTEFVSALDLAYGTIAMRQLSRSAAALAAGV